MPLNSDKKNGHGNPAIGRVVSEALFEDVPPETAVDPMPEAPDEEPSGLAGVPFLGPTRKRALVENGIRTISDLQSASTEQIGGVKGVGLRNAERIKEWLATQMPVSPGMPPPPPEMDTPTVVSPDPVLAQDNNTIFDGLGEIDALITTLRTGADGATVSKKLERQFDKIASVTSELAEGPDTLTSKQLQQAVKLLKRIVAVLQDATAHKRLSEKKQDALAEELRDQRKALQRALGD